MRKLALRLQIEQLQRLNKPRFRLKVTCRSKSRTDVWWLASPGM